MATIRVLVVGDGLTTGPTYGINFASTQDVTDNTFTVAELLYLLQSSTAPSISVDTAHRRTNAGATYQNFNFATSGVDLSQYDVLWLIGHEGWNGATFPGESPIGDDEVQAIANFMNGGGGVFATGDHNGLGSYMCGRIPRVSSMRKWFGRASDIPPGYPTNAVDYKGDTVTAVNWPGLSTGTIGRADTLQQNPSDTTTDFQFDDQSDAIPQPLTLIGVTHPILEGPTGPILTFPDHMHEGEVVTPVNLSQTLTINGQPFVEYPKVAGTQPAPAVIATGNIVAGHETQVEGSSCEQANFSTDPTPTVANTIGILCAYDGRAAGIGRVVTDSSFHHCLDINLIGDPCGSSIDRQQGFGAALAPPTSGGTLANMQAFFVNTVLWLARVEQTFYFTVDKSTFGFDEASDNSTFPNFANSFWLVVEGYSLSQVQSSLSSLQLSGPFAALGVISSPGTPQAQTGGAGPQRVVIPFGVQFSSASIGAFPTPGQPVKELLLGATIMIGGTSYLAETTMELGPGQDPQFQNINPALNNVFYQSQDLCIFTVTPGLNPVPIPTVPVPFTTSNPVGTDNAAATSFITTLLSTMNADSTLTTPSNTDPFSSFPSQIIAAGDAQGDSSVTPGVGIPPFQFTSYNFAIARVRLSGPVNASAQVKVFFRLFITQTSDTDYQPNLTYASQPDGAGLPSMPLPSPDGETIPFFAKSSAADYATNGPNNQNITIQSSQGAWHYFGCFLNVYDPSLNLALSGTHHCIVAQIAYDNAPIINSNGVTESPDNCDKLAQRNMQVTFSGFPSDPAAHLIPQTFDVRPSPAISQTGGQLLDYPDELMIEWGNTPHQSVASIYWPQVQAADVIKVANQIYAFNPFTPADPNTVQCTVNSRYTFLPLPAGTGQRIAGLFTIQLPAPKTSGQEYNIVVRRISSRQIGNSPVPIFEASRSAGSDKRHLQRNWRYVVGTFQIKIPVAPDPSILPSEQNTYAILLWRLNHLSPGSRWYPVLQRYVSYIAARVNAMGGNASVITPSPNGYIPTGGISPIVCKKEFTGKINGIIYDRFGDFEGFFLLTEEGHERAFRSTEAEIEALARFAWIDRVVITVLVSDSQQEVPVSIILRRAPGHRLQG